MAERDGRGLGAPEGPLRRPALGPELRRAAARQATADSGVPATRIAVAGHGRDRPLVVLTWNEASGTTWALEGEGVDDATLRGVAEALVLDPTTAAPADIAPEDVPDGFELSWRASEPAAAGPERRRWWIVELGEGADGCTIWVQTTGPGAAPAHAYARPGKEMLTVRGQEAVAFPDRWLVGRSPRASASRSRARPTPTAWSAWPSRWSRWPPTTLACHRADEQRPDPGPDGVGVAGSRAAGPCRSPVMPWSRPAV